jgi:carbonic anhydrase
MKNTLLIIGAISLTILFVSFNYSKSSGNWCYQIKCGNKTWYELSPKAYSPSEAKDIMKNKYPNCSVSSATDGHCK